MKVVCAPDSLKGSLSAVDAAAAMGRGVRAALPGAGVEVVEIPIADGGEGTVEALVRATGGELVWGEVCGPLPGTTVWAAWGWLGGTEETAQKASPSVGLRGGVRNTAVVELAATAGLALVPEQRRDPGVTTTFGVGQQIAAALDAGAECVVVGLGGSGTNDGGCGMAQALGGVFRDRLGGAGAVMEGPVTGERLSEVGDVDLSGLDVRLAGRLVVACDVTNPLTGCQGAAAVYGPQKGTTAEQVVELDAGLVNVGRVWRERLGVDVMGMPGAGAAGGCGGGVVAMLGGRLRRGIDLVLDAVGFADRVQSADLVLTGEGCLDGQSASGKAVMGVATAAREVGVETVALVGAAKDGAAKLLEEGLGGYCVIGEGLPEAESVRRAGELMAAAAERVCCERFG
ncbi:MAG: glycerate kinase [Planctomycetota bacterium]